MRRLMFVFALLAMLALVVPVEAQTPMPAGEVVTGFKVISLPAELTGNVSYVSWNIPDPEIGDQVVRVGGDIAVDAGEPLGAFLMGGKDPTNTPLLLGFNSGTGQMSLEFQACAPDCTNTEPYNDVAKMLLVADWAVKPGMAVTMWVDDVNGAGSGYSHTFDYAELSAAPSVKMLAVLLPQYMDNSVSQVSSALADVYTSELGNIGGFVMGWKGAPARGVALRNAGSFTQSLEVPQCPISGGEYTNDMHKVWVIFPEKQVLAGSQVITLDENDDVSNPGMSFSLNLNDFRDLFLTQKVFLPILSK